MRGEKLGDFKKNHIILPEIKNIKNSKDVKLHVRSN